MTTLARTAAIAGGLVSTAAVAVAVILPTHHATTAGGAGARVTAGTAAVMRGSGGSGAGQSPAGAGSAGAAGAGGTAGAGAGSSGAGHGSTGGGSSGAGSSGGSAASGTGSTGGGSSGTGSTGTGGSHTVHPVISSFPHLLIPLVTTLPSPTGTIGDPGVPCLQGYVWRQAYAGDYVCVTPATRTEAAADNAAALSRVQAGGGAYGQYTCIQGYVWRQVVSDDYTCVTPAVRAAAAADNSQAANRVALLDLWVTDWTPPSQPTQNCSGGVCTTTAGGWGGPNFQINGDLFNDGPVLLEVRRNDDSLVWSTTVWASTYAGFPGGALYAQAPVGDCSSVPGTTDNEYVTAFDTLSGRWSAKLPINSDCASF